MSYITGSDAVTAGIITDALLEKQTMVGGVRCASAGPDASTYDVRASGEFHTLNIPPHMVVDPSNFDFNKYTNVLIADEYILGPSETVLIPTIETFNIPLNMTVLVIAKSTHARCGVTPITSGMKPGWSGRLVIEMINPNKFSLLIKKGEGIASLLFLTGDNTDAYEGRFNDQTGMVYATGKSDADVLKSEPEATCNQIATQLPEETFENACRSLVPAILYRAFGFKPKMELVITGSSARAMYGITPSDSEYEIVCVRGREDWDTYVRIAMADGDQQKEYMAGGVSYAALVYDGIMLYHDPKINFFRSVFDGREVCIQALPDIIGLLVQNITQGEHINVETNYDISNYTNDPTH